ncbi:MAG: hypothetical protein E7406_07090 [Ruminococcaceae bacterium]|nr:hypothetical protein [Oscillospiraceae bacterium]
MKKVSLIYIILASVLWGTSGIFVHYTSSYGFSSLQMTLIRVLVSLVCMGIYIFIADRKLFKTNIKELLLFAGSGIGLFGTASFYFSSMELTSVSTGVVLMYTAPILVMLFSVTFLGEKLTKVKAASVVFMLVGCGLVSGIIGGIEFNPLGIVLGFLSGVSYAAYNIFTKIEMKHKSNPITANFYCFLFATLVGILISEPQEIPVFIAKNPVVTIPLTAGMGIVTCILPYLFYTMALKNIPAGTASSMAILEPMSATVFSVAILNEQLHLTSVLGIILILGSVLVLSKQKE